jgi:cation diffusion facilitator family transporter
VPPAIHHPTEPWAHSHDFLPDASAAERGTGLVIWLTAVMMVVEIVGGTLLGSMALLADGWHMATHVAAFGIAIFAYRYARTRAADPRFAFGTAKVTVLGGFASAVALGVIAVLMALESLLRLFQPHAIQFDQAIWVAAIGLVVNLVSGLILHRAGHDHGAHDDHHDHHDHAHDHAGHDDDHDHDHDHEHEHDHNLRAAYLHVVADALTSVLAIGALLAGKLAGWNWMDAVTGIVGSIVITRWALGLAAQSSAILIDRSEDVGAAEQIRALLEADAGHEVTDLHVWQLAPGRLSATVTIVAHAPRDPQYYRRKLAAVPRLTHTVIEVNECRDAACREAQ